VTARPARKKNLEPAHPSSDSGVPGVAGDGATWVPGGIQVLVPELVVIAYRHSGVGVQVQGGVDIIETCENHLDLTEQVHKHKKR
jgi:hypothetical protein